VWYAYNKFGVDLDSNGGMLAMVRDIALSDKAEVVQSFGFAPDARWA